MHIEFNMMTAMNTYGWNATYYMIKGGDSVNACSSILEICRQKNIEILLLEEEVLGRGRNEMLQQLRYENPSIKIVGCWYDTWLQDSNSLLERANQVDVVWDMVFPSLSVWKNPIVSNKMLHIPHPLADKFGLSNQPLIPQMMFSGSIGLFNWHRKLWLAAAECLRLPIKKQLSNGMESSFTDGLSPVESYANYVQKLAAATCCLNLTMRQDLSCIVTGRSFETICYGSLLVQEMSQNMHYYFIPGEHYLEFSTIAELSAVAKFITDQREEAEEIRRCGHAFAMEHYNNDKLIGYLDKMLYFKD